MKNLYKGEIGWFKAEDVINSLINAVKDKHFDANILLQKFHDIVKNTYHPNLGCVCSFMDNIFHLIDDDFYCYCDFVTEWKETFTISGEFLAYADIPVGVDVTIKATDDVTINNESCKNALIEMIKDKFDLTLTSHHHIMSDKSDFYSFRLNEDGDC